MPNGAQYGEYAGSTMRLEYAGFGELHGECSCVAGSLLRVSTRLNVATSSSRVAIRASTFLNTRRVIAHSLQSVRATMDA